MEIRVAILCVISHVILTADLKRNTTEYLGCYERFDDYSEFEWETSTIQSNVDSTTALFKECQSQARVKGLSNVSSCIYYCFLFTFSFKHML